MINVYNDYVILVDDMNYTAAIDKHKTDKNGKPIYNRIGYYNTLRGAVKGILDYDCRIALSDGEKSLDEAIRMLNEACDRLDSILDKIEG